MLGPLPGPEESNTRSNIQAEFGTVLLPKPFSKTQRYSSLCPKASTTFHFSGHTKQEILSLGMRLARRGVEAYSN